MSNEDPDYGALNLATAQVTLFYYYLLEEGGITNDQTVYLDPALFNPIEYLNLDLPEDVDINQELLREGALMHLLCDLNDIVGQFEDDYLSQPKTGEILNALASCTWAQPHLERLIELVRQPLSTPTDFRQYRAELDQLNLAYVVSRYQKMLIQS